MSRRMLITAGPTHEPIDEVRYIANRSSGRMGIAIAHAARDAEWVVTLLLGPVAIAPSHSEGAAFPPLPLGEGPGVRAKGRADVPNSPRCDSPGPALDTPANDIRILRFITTEDLRNLLTEHFPKCDVLVMAAAVADYRPVKSTAGKIERGEKRLTLELEPTPDLVAECAQRKHPDQFIVGFALEEPDKLRDRALEKLKRKGLDAIVANSLETMGSETINGKIYRLAESGEVQESESVRGKKPHFAQSLIEWLEIEIGEP